MCVCSSVFSATTNKAVDCCHSTKYVRDERVVQNNDRVKKLKCWANKSSSLYKKKSVAKRSTNSLLGNDDGEWG